MLQNGSSLYVKLTGKETRPHKEVSFQGGEDVTGTEYMNHYENDS